jgi:RND superfamily putative drug exporter
MLLTGKANWWLPRWLDRALPHLNVEGDVHDGPRPEQRTHSQLPIGDPVRADGPA